MVASLPVAGWGTRPCHLKNTTRQLIPDRSTSGGIGNDMRTCLFPDCHPRLDLPSYSRLWTLPGSEAEFPAVKVPTAFPGMELHHNTRCNLCQGFVSVTLPSIQGYFQAQVSVATEGRNSCRLHQEQTQLLDWVPTFPVY